MVGDRRLLRFYRGKQKNLKAAIEMYSNFLKFRVLNDVDEIRQDIVYGGKDTPLKFPHGEKILKIAPGIVLSAQAPNARQEPLWLDTFNFIPKQLLKEVTLEQYLLYLIYCMEYRALVLEQLSEEQEQQLLFQGPEQLSDGYGVITMFYCIRDLTGNSYVYRGV